MIFIFHAIDRILLSSDGISTMIEVAQWSKHIILWCCTWKGTTMWDLFTEIQTFEHGHPSTSKLDFTGIC